MSYELIRETTQAARKRYLCIWCGEHIIVGERYLYEFSKYEGDPQKQRWHMECKAAAEDWFREDGESEFTPHENERPPSAGAIEYASWMVALHDQQQLRLVP